MCIWGYVTPFLRRKGSCHRSHLWPPRKLFSNSAYGLLQKNITFWKIYKSSSCRKTTFPVPLFNSLYQSCKSCSLKMGYLGDPQGGSEECSVLLTTKHTSWEVAHITSPCLPKKGGNIFSHLPGSQPESFKARLGQERPPFGAERVCNRVSTTVTILCQPISLFYACKYVHRILEIMRSPGFRTRRVCVCDRQILITMPEPWKKKNKNNTSVVLPLW